LLIYYHIDEVSRDTIVASALRNELKKVGGRLIFGNRMTMSLLRYFNVFDAVILPSLNHYMSAFPNSDHLPDNIVILPSEAVGLATSNLHRINAKYFGNDIEFSTPWHQSVTKYLLWGFDHLKAFQEFYPEYLKKCKVVGNPRLADACIAPVRNKTGSKRVVGFVTRFSLLNNYNDSSNLHSIYHGRKLIDGKLHPKFENSEDHDIEDLMYTEAMDLRVFFEVMQALDPDKFILSVRIHPRENWMQWEDFVKKQGLNVTVSKYDDPFSVWLREVDIVVSPPSTSFYEMLYYGISPICTRDVCSRRADHVLTESDDNNQILNYVYCPKSVDEIVDTINNGKVPELSEGSEKILEGQVGLSIMKNSISNIVESLACFSGDTRMNVVKLRHLLPLAVVAMVILSYFKSWRYSLLGEIEPGCNFTFTLRRLKMIGRLAEAIKR
jgi:hypothetical protein